MNKKIIILSGGLDSTTLMYRLVIMYGAENVSAISFNYGSKHNKIELEMAEKSCKKLEVSHKIFDLSPVFKNFNSALLDHEDSEEIPEGHYEDKSMKKTVVPFRNGILLAIAIGFAETEDSDEVYYGAHAGDHAIYPDCRKSFIKYMDKAGKKGTYNEVRIKAPFQNASKIDIVRIANAIDVDFSLTWTCYNPQDGKPCDKCGSCQERAEAFKENNLIDPLTK